MLDNIYIHYVADERELEEIKSKKFEDLTFTEQAQRVANIHTHGMESYGHKNLCLTVAYDADYAAWLLNSIAECIVEESDTFNFDNLHCFDEPDGKGGYTKPYLYFALRKVKCCDEECYLVIRTNNEGVPIDIVNIIPENWSDEIVPIDEFSE